MTRRRRPNPRGLTLIELLVVVALLGTVLALGAPSLFDYIRVQRLKSISAQLTTDLQFARSRAVGRDLYSFVLFPSGSTLRCYTLYELPPTADSMTERCDCSRGPGAACEGTVGTEVRTVVLPAADGVHMAISGRNRGFGFDPVTGGLITNKTDKLPVPLDEIVIDTVLDSTRTLRTTIGRAGRPTICGIGNGLGVPAC
ncbi:pilus assembly protein FimT [Rubrivivax gelatinosus]|uniref:pilus assembly FimT family protein n=1 Tax=Rubrivivax gelatinosus TaxID=28068 RepID=UPI0019055D77|nr:prepilin-type N-terminal cleavage/methylation domain-containing protein [Rubrivivax gelatinosus]MBK1614169.1 pilus assembly protein FimT [Rubrivivax gelatinosus]